MESLLHLDNETDIPLSLIDVAPWNAKTPINGVYRKGLHGSLTSFGIRDRLKVWPSPDAKGRYVCLNGNQRIDLITEDLIRSAARERFGAGSEISETSLTKMIEDPQNLHILEDIKRNISSFKIPCQVMTKLDSKTKLDKSDARLFTLSFDRNQAKHDEVQLANEYRTLLAEKTAKATAENRENLARRLKAIVRPELPTIEPPKTHAPSPDQTAFSFAEPGSFTPTQDEPWGPVPTVSHSVSGGVSGQSNFAESFVPMVFSFTSEGYKQITDSIMRSKSRVFREQKLLTALERLDKISREKHEDPSELDDRISSIVAEIALRTTNEHIKQLEQI